MMAGMGADGREQRHRVDTTRSTRGSVCTKVSAACDHCYAEAWDARGLQGQPTRWGPHASRTRTSAGNWRSRSHEPKGCGRGPPLPGLLRQSRRCLRQSWLNLSGWRGDLWHLIARTPNLDWLLLTKRPQNIPKMLPDGYGAPAWGDGWPNVWLGTSTENRVEMLRRGEALARIPARVRFWSAEPLVGDLRVIPESIMPDWIITGGENGAHFRPVNPDWFRGLRDQCVTAGVPFLFKQWEGRSQREIKAKGRALDGVVHDGYPTPLTPVLGLSQGRGDNHEDDDASGQQINGIPGTGVDRGAQRQFVIKVRPRDRRPDHRARTPSRHQHR